jgi:hypothetical protein
VFENRFEEKEFKEFEKLVGKAAFNQKQLSELPHSYQE